MVGLGVGVNMTLYGLLHPGGVTGLLSILVQLIAGDQAEARKLTVP